MNAKDQQKIINKIKNFIIQNNKRNLNMVFSIDIILPVYNEEENILETIQGIKNNVKNSHRILIIYDYNEDPTINIVKKFRRKYFIN